MSSGYQFSRKTSARLLLLYGKCMISPFHELLKRIMVVQKLNLIMSLVHHKFMIFHFHETVIVEVS